MQLFGKGRPIYSLDLMHPQVTLHCQTYTKQQISVNMAELRRWSE